VECLSVLRRGRNTPHAFAAYTPGTPEPNFVAPVRVELFPFAHPFRAGSRLRLAIDAPGGNRPVWQFDTIDKGETVTIAYDAQHPSKLVLPVVAGVDVPKAAPPACGSLRGEPCRPWVKAANGG
jgi:predicted acyl esterase